MTDSYKSDDFFLLYLLLSFRLFTFLAFSFFVLFRHRLLDRLSLKLSIEQLTVVNHSNSSVGHIIFISLHHLTNILDAFVDLLVWSRLNPVIVDNVTWLGMQHELGELVLTCTLLLIGWPVSFVETLLLVVSVVQAVDLSWSVFNM